MQLGGSKVQMSYDQGKQLRLGISDNTVRRGSTAGVSTISSWDVGALAKGGLI
jgi:hypothetical protein